MSESSLRSVQVNSPANITPSTGNTEYSHYLQTQRWRTLARAVKLRAKGKCEICKRADGRDCAHLTYDRIFNEPLSDLLWLCRACHRKLDEEGRS